MLKFCAQIKDSFVTDDITVLIDFKEHRTQSDCGKAKERACWKAGIAGQGLVSKHWKIVVNYLVLIVFKRGEDALRTFF